MDKNQYAINAEKIQKLVKNGDYAGAVAIAEEMEWSEVHSVRLLTITAAAYEKTRDYNTAIELLEAAYEESPTGKRILYKLTGLAIALKDVNRAQKYYEKYLKEASDDNGRYLLRYLLAELKQEALDKRIAILETYRKFEFEEQWALRLAQLYDEAGMKDSCVKLCDEIILWFGVGDCVDEALRLKEKYAPLSEAQEKHRDNKEFFEQRYRETVDELNGREEALAAEMRGPEEEEPEEEPEPAGEAPKQQAREEEPDDSWMEQLLLIEADSMNEAIGRALEALDAYYTRKGEAMGRLTRIPADRFNAMGLEKALPHIAGKDLLVDDASALSEELLSDILHLLRDEKYPRVFVLADEKAQLPYLDARLGEYLSRKQDIPSIEVTAPEEQVLIGVGSLMEEEQAEENAAPTARIETISVREEPQPAAILPAEPETVPEEAAEAAPAEEPPLQAVDAEVLLSDAVVAEQMSLFDMEESEDRAPEATVYAEPVREEMPAETAENTETAEIAEELAESELPAEEPAPEPEEEEKDFLDSLSGRILAAAVENEAAMAEEEPLPEELPAEEPEKTETEEPVLSDSPVITETSRLQKLLGMTDEAFVAYAINYMASIDCVLGEGAEEALIAATAARRAEDKVLTKELAEAMIEAAADAAEKKMGLFARRYDRDGNLILKAKHIQ